MLNVFQILASLNPEQRTVVKSINGPYFVLSGPGSGKTKCLVSRTQYMLYNKIAPESILLFTFTVKAANEIKERIAESIDKSAAEKITIGTYHSVCLRILKKYYTWLGLFKENFTIYDQTDTSGILKKLCSSSTIDQQTIANYISDQKDNLLSPEESLKNSNTSIDNEKALLYSEYQKILVRNNAIDFDDILFYTVKLLQSFPKIREELNEQYKYIISDETQDASTSNICLLQLLSQKYNNICMFLDDDQSIYGFRGANLNSILSIPGHMQNMTILHLNQNYRSTQNIVNGALSVINHNKKREQKELFTCNQTGQNIIYTEKYNTEQESKNAINLVKYLVEKKGLAYSDVAILYRNNALSRPLESVLMQNNIPYSIKNGLAFFERKEIKDVLAYIRFILNHYDDEAFKRIINIPQRGIGTVTINKIEKYVDEHIGTDIIKCCEEIIANKMFGAGTLSKLKEFVDYINTSTEVIDDYMPHEFVTKLIREINYSAVLLKDDPDTYVDRYANVLQLVTMALGYIDIRDFVSSVALIQNTDEENDNKVTLTTMHGCKGLEWKAVIVIGLNDSVIPGRSDEEEERRLFYVAMTRAKEYLFLSRPIFTPKCSYANAKCRFIDEIDKQYVSDISTIRR